MNNYQFSFDVSDDKLKNKDYNMLVVGGINLYGNWDPTIANKYMSINDFKQMLKDSCHINRHKVNRVIQTFLDLKIIRKQQNYYYLNDVVGYYIRLKPDTVKYMMDNLSDNCFKIYCYLKSKYQLHLDRNYRENYYFSHTELLRMMGYTKSAANIKTVKEHLHTLESLGLIDYEHELVGRPGKHGLYMQLYEVFEEGIPQEKVKEEMLNQCSQLIGEVDDRKEYYLQLLNNCDTIEEAWKVYNMLPEGKRTQDSVNIVTQQDAFNFIEEEIKNME